MRLNVNHRLKEQILIFIGIDWYQLVSKIVTRWLSISSVIRLRNLFRSTKRSQVFPGFKFIRVKIILLFHTIFSRSHLNGKREAYCLVSSNLKDNYTAGNIYPSISIISIRKTQLVLISAKLYEVNTFLTIVLSR